MVKKSIVVRVHPDLLGEIERIKIMHYELTGRELSTYEASQKLRPPQFPTENKKKKRGMFNFEL